MGSKLSPVEPRRGALGTAAAAGAVAYVAGYVLTFVLVRAEARRTFGESVPTWKAVGWYFYNAHFVDVVSSRSVGPFGDAAAVNLLAESSGATATFLYVVPPLALLAAGGVVAWPRGGADVVTAATRGAAVVLGYGPLAVLGALVVQHTVSGSFLGVDASASVTVPLASAVVVAALLYPVVLGATGAVLGATVRRHGAAGEPVGG